MPIGVRVAAAWFTALLVFVLTYWSAWTSVRGVVATGDFDGHRYWMLHNYEFVQQALSPYVERHEHYPESLCELRGDPSAKDLIDESGQLRWGDPWGNTLQYRKTEEGFRLRSLGRDGQPGGEGLDADVDIWPGGPIDFQPTFRQFVFEGWNSSRLFVTACLGSILAGLACFLARFWHKDRPCKALRILLGIALVTIAAVVLALFMTLAHVTLNRH